jgi:thioesterase domain-containing protein
MTQGSEPGSSRIVALKRGGDAKPLFMFAGVGGGPETFIDLAAQLGDERPIYAFHHIGALGECEPVRQVSRMAQLYAAELRGVQPHGPYYLFGYSFGGAVVVELARELVTQGERVGLVIMADCPAPGYPRPAPLLKRLKTHAENLLGMHEQRRTDYLRQRFNNLSTRVQKLAGLIPNDDPQHLSEQVRRLEAALYESYRHYHALPIGLDVLFLTADTPPEWPTASFDDPLMGWGDVLRGRISQCAIPGAHLTVFAPQNLPVMAARIRGALERALRAERREDRPSTVPLLVKSP